MATDALVQPLLELPLFRGLKPLQLTEIVRNAERIVYQPGDMIAEEDKESDAAIVIVSGDAVRLAEGELHDGVDPIPEGSLVCELAMLVELVHSSTIVAKSKVRALKITRESMHAQMEQDPELARYLTEKISARLRAIAEELQEVARGLPAYDDLDPLQTGESHLH